MVVKPQALRWPRDITLPPSGRAAGQLQPDWAAYADNA